ncbi:MAG TPA: hypothetical protein VN721_01795, partial [Flavipsychrobacter sp.]|nr:hypothetical protein [Flavipsychrobacter sp.]
FSRVEQGGEINSETRNEINGMCKHIYKSLQQRQSGYIKSILSKTIKDRNASAVDSIVNEISIDTINQQYKVEGEFLVKNFLHSNIKEVAYKVKDSDDSYHFNFVPISNRTYIMLFSVPTLNIHNSLLISCLFCEENDQWKLYSMNFGLFKIKGMQAIQLYKIGREKVKNGDDISGVIYEELARECALPADNEFHYDSETELKNFLDSFNQDLRTKFKLPIKINSIWSHPEILSIKSQMTKEGFYPYILYRTNISIADTIALQKENNQLHAQIDTILPHVKQSFDTILYKAVNDYSNETHETPQHGFIKGTR